MPFASTYRPLAIICGITACLPLYAAGPQRTSTTIAPGITLQQEVTRSASRGGPLAVTVVRISARKSRQIHAALGRDQVGGNDPARGRETVSRYVARHRPDVLAAINASFFGTGGNPLGLHVQNGEMVTEPSSNRSVFCIMKNGKAAVERFTFSGSATAGRVTIPLDGMNREPGKGNELLVFTPRFSRATPRAPGRVEIVLGRVTQKVSPRATFFAPVQHLTRGGATPLAANTLVLSGGGQAASFLRRAAAAKNKIVVRLDTRAMGNPEFSVQRVREAVAGGPRLVTRGRSTVTWAAEGMAPAFATRRHPRTAVGIAANGDILLFTVDGRQPGVSRGVSLKELAQMLMKWGVRDGVNLDGGGSSAFVVRGLLVNAPADGRERPVANFLTVESTPLSGSTKKRQRNFLRPQRPLRVGETWTFVSPYNKSEDGVWGLPGGQPVVGFVSQQGMFRAIRPGTTRISWIPRQGATVTLPITIVPRKTPMKAPTRSTTRRAPRDGARPQ